MKIHKIITFQMFPWTEGKRKGDLNFKTLFVKKIKET